MLCLCNEWIYNGEKVSSLNKQGLLNNLSQADISSSTINKFFNDGLIHSKSELLDLIDANFSEIFKIETL